MPPAIFVSALSPGFTGVLQERPLHWLVSEREPLQEKALRQTLGEKSNIIRYRSIIIERPDHFANEPMKSSC